MILACNFSRDIKVKKGDNFHKVGQIPPPTNNFSSCISQQTTSLHYEKHSVNGVCSDNQRNARYDIITTGMQMFANVLLLRSCINPYPANVENRVSS